MTDIRWKQRFDNYCKAFSELKDGTEQAQQRALNKLEQQGLIQGFEYTHELAWNLLKDYLEFQGHVGLIGSRDTTREAFKRGLIADGETWMEMIKSRNLTSHAYDTDTAQVVYTAIVTRYFTQFQALHTAFTKRFTEETG